VQFFHAFGRQFGAMPPVFWKHAAGRIIEFKKKTVFRMIPCGVFTS
jgi:hypothetical protein